MKVGDDVVGEGVRIFWFVLVGLCWILVLFEVVEFVKVSVDLECVVGVFFDYCDEVVGEC